MAQALNEREEQLDSKQNNDGPDLFVTKVQPLVDKMQFTVATIIIIKWYLKHVPKRTKKESNQILLSEII